MMNDWNDQGQHAMGGGGWIFGIIAMVLLVAVVVAGLVALYKMGKSKPVAASNSLASPSVDPAVEILKKRFAKGDIGEEEYLQRLELLRRG